MVGGSLQGGLLYMGLDNITLWPYGTSGFWLVRNSKRNFSGKGLVLPEDGYLLMSSEAEDETFCGKTEGEVIADRWRLQRTLLDKINQGDTGKNLEVE